MLFVGCASASHVHLVHCSVVKPASVYAAHVPIHKYSQSAIGYFTSYSYIRVLNRPKTIIYDESF